MSESRLYPDPPHLSAAVYCDSFPETEVFGRICRAVQSEGGIPNGFVRVFREGADFDFVTDLGAAAEEIDVSVDRFWDLVEGRVPGLSTVKAGFRADVGLVVVSYELRDRQESRHPIDAHIGAGMLGIPEFLWEPQDRAAAAWTAERIRNLLRRVCKDVRPLYGVLAEEETLPAPPDLAGLRSQDLYIADRVLAADPDLERDLEDFYGTDRIERWDAGIFCVSWDVLQPGKTFSKAPAAENHWPGTRLARAISLMQSRHRDQGPW